MLSRDEWVVGLDIGTTKVCTVVGRAEDDGLLTIAGIGLVPSRGIKKGVVVDVEDTVAAIRDSVERARHMAGVSFDAVVVGVTGDHIESSNLRGTVSVAGQDDVVTAEDVERALQAAALDVPRDRQIIHSLPRDFTVDGHRGVRRPVGMCGQRLEVETHIVTGSSSFLQNVVQCVERAGLSVEGLVLEPIATSEAVATSDERELGVALIDIGGGTSDIAVFIGGSIVQSAVIPVGGNQVTRDVSIGLRTALEMAERLKIERGMASTGLVPHGEALDIVTAGSGERLRLPLTVLAEIIEARMTELFEMAQAIIATSASPKQLPAGIILTGGGALLPGSLELARQIFNLPVRLGRPLDIGGWKDQVNSPQFATGVGLLRFAMHQRGLLRDPLTATLAGPHRNAWQSPERNGVPFASRLDADEEDRHRGEDRQRAEIAGVAPADEALAVAPPSPSIERTAGLTRVTVTRPPVVRQPNAQTAVMESWRRGKTLDEDSGDTIQDEDDDTVGRSPWHRLRSWLRNLFAFETPHDD